ncbi:MAG TPA: hypothetical protein VGC99_17890 [Candidatus Tectomicrobia bacterium]
MGIAGLTTDDQYGTPEHGRHVNRRAFRPSPINALVVRQWRHRDDGPGGKAGFLTNAPVDRPLQPFDDDDERHQDIGRAPPCPKPSANAERCKV